MPVVIARLTIPRIDFAVTIYRSEYRTIIKSVVVSSCVELVPQGDNLVPVAALEFGVSEINSRIDQADDNPRVCNRPGGVSVGYFFFTLMSGVDC